MIASRCLVPAFDGLDRVRTVLVLMSRFCRYIHRVSGRSGSLSSAEVVSRDEVIQVPPQLIMVVTMEAFDGSALDGPVHPFFLTVCRITPTGNIASRSQSRSMVDDPLLV